MAAQLWETISSRELKRGLYGLLEATLHFGMRGVGDEAAAATLLEANIALTFQGLYFQTYQLTPKNNDDVWEATVNYGRRFPESFAIDTGSERVHITTSKQTIERYVPAGKEKIDFKRALNVKDNAGRRVAEGLDIGITGGAFTKTLVLPSPLNAGWVQSIFDKSWHVNSDPVIITVDPAGTPMPGILTTRTSDTAGTITMASGSHGITSGQTVDISWPAGAFPLTYPAGAAYGCTVGTVSGTSVPILSVLYDDPLPPEDAPVLVAIRVASLFLAGELLYQEGTLNRRGAEDWEIVLRGQRSPNATNIAIGPAITVAQKKGWEYLWVWYEEQLDPDSNVLVCVPRQANVEKIYDPATLDDVFNPSWWQ